MRALSMARLLPALVVALAGCGGQSGHPVQQATVTPAGLRLTASLDRSRLGAGSTATLRAQLRNEGTRTALLPPDSPCSPALQVRILDSGDRIVWAQPLPMCFPVAPLQPAALAPGAALSAERCFRLGPARSEPASACAALELPAGGYSLRGSFHNVELPALDLTVV